MSDLKTLEALNRDYISSVQNGDVRRFDEILAPEFYCSNPDGRLVDRAAFLAQTAHPFDVGTTYMLVFTRVDKNYTCADSPTMLSDQFDNAAGPNIGFRNRTASASFPWIMVVKSP